MIPLESSLQQPNEHISYAQAASTPIIDGDRKRGVKASKQPAPNSLPLRRSRSQKNRATKRRKILRQKGELEQEPEQPKPWFLQEGIQISPDQLTKARELAEQRNAIASDLRDLLKQIPKVERPKNLTRSRIPIRTIEAYLRYKSSEAEGHQWDFMCELSNVTFNYDKVCAEIQSLRNSVLPGPPKSSHRFTVPGVITRRRKSQQKKRLRTAASGMAASEDSLMVPIEEPSTSANRPDVSQVDDVEQNLELQENSDSSTPRVSLKVGVESRKGPILKKTPNAPANLGKMTKGQKPKVSFGPY
jgi:hypothetical protein